MPDPRAPRRGFTLIETMVAGTLFISLALMVMIWMTGLSDLWWTTTTQAEMRMNSQLAMNRLVNELRTGTRTMGGSPPNAVIPAAPGNTTVTFYLPADLDAADGNTTIIDAIGNIEWDNANAIQYVYDAPSRQLRRVQGANTVILANDVQSVTFEDAVINPALSQNEMRITLALQRLTPQRRTLTATTIEIVKLRN